MGKSKHNIYLRRDGRWEGRLAIGAHDGKTQYRYVYAKTKEDAEHKLMSLMGEMHPDKDTCRRITTFGDVACTWLATSRMRLKASSIAQYTGVLDRYLLPAFGDKDITVLRRGDFTALCAMLLEKDGISGVGLGGATVASIISVAKNIFLFAECEEELPVADISKLKVKQAHKPPKTLDTLEQKKLEEALRADLSPCNLGILLCLYTGMRIGELCALRWQDIAEDNRSVFVVRTMQRIQKHDGSGTEVVLMTPKSERSERVIPVPKHIRKLLSQCRQTDSAWLLTADPKHFMEPRCLQYRFKTLLKSCGIRDINFHALRHTFATRCNELGFDSKTLSEIMGHSAVGMTLGRYVHPTMAQKRKNMELLHPLSAVK